MAQARESGGVLAQESTADLAPVVAAGLGAPNLRGGDADARSHLHRAHPAQRISRRQPSRGIGRNIDPSLAESLSPAGAELRDHQLPEVAQCDGGATLR